MLRSMGCWLVFGALAGCAATGKTPVEATNPQGKEMAAAAQSAPEAQPLYRFYPGDQLSIMVLRRPELSVTTKVDPYGYIAYPYLGQVQVRSLNGAELAQRLASGLQEGQYYNSPVITVALVSSSERFVYVLGEVKRPGPVATSGGLPLLAAIGAAGGQTYDAEMSTVLWIRGSQSPPGMVKLNLKEFGDPRGKDAVPNLTMVPGDVLYIPDTIIASVERFMNRMFNVIRPVVELERGIVLYPDVERYLQGDYDPQQNKIILTK